MGFMEKAELNKTVKDYKELDVWKRAVQLAVDVYKILESFPVSEKHTIVDQIKRSVISVPSNIAEGTGRNTTKEFIYYLYIARGSLSELETQMIIAEKLMMCETPVSIYNDIIITKKQINAFINSLKRKTK